MTAQGLTVDNRPAFADLLEASAKWLRLCAGCRPRRLGSERPQKMLPLVRTRSHLERQSQAKDHLEKAKAAGRRERMRVTVPCLVTGCVGLLLFVVWLQVFYWTGKCE